MFCNATGDVGHCILLATTGGIAGFFSSSAMVMDYV
jgi:hypothetical protein